MTLTRIKYLLKMNELSTVFQIDIESFKRLAVIEAVIALFHKSCRNTLSRGVRGRKMQIDLWLFEQTAECNELWL